jgi:hypothetical protein
MKTYLIALLALVTIGFSSCDLEGGSNYTPDIFFLVNPVKNHTDTLNRYYTDKSGVYLMDTIAVGDTVSFVLYLEGYANNLLSFRMQTEPDSVTKIILPAQASMDSIFVAGTQYDKGIFMMSGKHTALVFPFRYVALKPANSAKISFAVLSDAKFDNMFGSNSNGFELKTPIKLK